MENKYGKNGFVCSFKSSTHTMSVSLLFCLFSNPPEITLCCLIFVSQSLTVESRKKKTTTTTTTMKMFQLLNKKGRYTSFTKRTEQLDCAPISLCHIPNTLSNANQSSCLIHSVKPKKRNTLHNPYENITKAWVITAREKGCINFRAAPFHLLDRFNAKKKRTRIVVVFAV